MTHLLDIVGVGEGGIAGLPPMHLRLIAMATVVIGPQRLLDGLASLPSPSPPSPPSPVRGGTEGGGGATNAGASGWTPTPSPSPQGGGEPAGVSGQERPRLIPWASGLDAMLAQLEGLRGSRTVVLASGDPNWFGIGATLASRLPAEEFAIHPAPSAFQLAAARLRWPLQHVATLSLHGRPPERIHPHLLPGNRILALTSDAAALPATLGLLRARGYGASIVTVLENLGGPGERITSGTAEALDTAVGDFHVLAIDCLADPGAALLPAVPGLPDDAFVNDGQLTKREVRAATLAKLAPTPGALLWDVGAGCGSVAIEWMRAARDAHAIAFERDGARLQMIAANAAALGVPGLRIEGGAAPGALAGMPAPDAVFIGGGLGDPAIAETCWAALPPGGRLVANAVTLDGEQALLALHARLGGELCRIDVAPLDAVGGHRAFRPRLPVTQYWVTKP